MTREFTGTGPEGETVPGRPRDLARPKDRSRKKDRGKGRLIRTDAEIQIERHR